MQSDSVLSPVVYGYIAPSINTIQWNSNSLCSCSSMVKLYWSKLQHNIPFNSQGHIGTGPQYCHLQNTYDDLWSLNLLASEFPALVP